MQKKKKEKERQSDVKNWRERRGFEERMKREGESTCAFNTESSMILSFFSLIHLIKREIVTPLPWMDRPDPLPSSFCWLFSSSNSVVLLFFSLREDPQNRLNYRKVEKRRREIRERRGEEDTEEEEEDRGQLEGRKGIQYHSTSPFLTQTSSFSVLSSHGWEWENEEKKERRRERLEESLEDFKGRKKRGKDQRSIVPVWRRALEALADERLAPILKERRMITLIRNEASYERFCCAIISIMRRKVTFELWALLRKVTYLAFTPYIMCTNWLQITYFRSVLGQWLMN